MNFKCLSRLLVIAGCLAVLGVGSLMANEDYRSWAKHMEITFPGFAPPGSSTLTNFPVLVVLSNTTAGAGFNYTDFLSPPYGDLRFTASDLETPLDYEIELWDTDGISHVWVRVPEFNVNTTIHAFWGKGGVAALPCTTNGAVWESNYAAVYHLSDAASGAHDSTANALNAKNTYSVSNTASAAGRGGLFDGSTSYINMGNNAAIEPTHLTLSAWVQVTGPGSNNDTSGSWLISKGRVGVAPNVSYALAHLPGNGKLKLFLNGGANVIESTTTHPANSPAFHVAATYDGSHMRLYVNGQLNVYTARSPVIGYGYADRDLHIGGWNLSAQYPRRFKGLIDEVRISKIARSADWIQAEYLKLLTAVTKCCIA